MATTASIEAPAGRQSTAIERSLALGLAAVATALNVAALVLGLAATAVVGTLAVTPIGTYGAFVLVLTLVAVGLILRARRPDHRLGWTFLGFGLVAAVSHLCWSVMLGAQLPGGDSTTAAWVSWIGATVSILGWPYLVTAILVRFPTGAPESSLEARVLRSSAVVCAVAVVFVALRPGPLFAYPGFVNPVAVPTDLRRCSRLQRISPSSSRSDHPWWRSLRWWRVRRSPSKRCR